MMGIRQLRPEYGLHPQAFAVGRFHEPTTETEAVEIIADLCRADRGY